GFAGQPIVQDTPTIDFDWGFGSPTNGIPVDSFSARWTGTIMPTVSDSYAFSALAAGGVRIYLDDQMILDNWIEHPESEAFALPRELLAGSVYKLRVDFFETTGRASIHVFWSTSSMPKQLVRFQDAPDGTEAQFGSVMAGFGNGRFVVGAPDAEVLI